MGKIEYDPFDGWERLALAAERIDPRAAEIFAYHAALEAEVDFVLSHLLRRAEKVRRLGFGQKVAVLGAAWAGEPDAGDLICTALARFNDLRNAVAHPADGNVDACIVNLRAAHRGFDSDAKDNASVAEVAQCICAFFGDGPTPAQVEEVAEAMAGLIARFSDALGSIKFEMPKTALQVPKVGINLTDRERGLTPERSPGETAKAQDATQTDPSPRGGAVVV